MGKTAAYQVDAAPEQGSIVPEPLIAPRLGDGGGKKRRKSFFEGVAAEFDQDLDLLRTSYVEWQLVQRARKKGCNLIDRVRLDFSPALEKLFVRYSHPRHIHLHKIALPLCVVVFLGLVIFDTVKHLPPDVGVTINRAAILSLLIIGLVVTRVTRLKDNLAAHLSFFSVCFLGIAVTIAHARVTTHENFTGGVGGTLCTFAAFLLVESHYWWIFSTGVGCALTQLLYLYISQPDNYPMPLIHGVLMSMVVALVGGSTYLYLVIKLARKSFLDQVLARLQAHQLEREKDRLDGLLHVILPKTIAARLKAGEQPIADRFDDATVLFIEVLDFEAVVKKNGPLNAVKILNKLYARFDHVSERYHVMRVKIIGTTYMAICGIPSIRQHHSELGANVAFGAMDEVDKYNKDNSLKFGIRIGINSGPLVAGVIGVQKFCYDVWGDTVNTAARMCTHAEPGTIRVTQAVRDKLTFAFEFMELDEAFVKGKGKMVNYRLTSKKVFEKRTQPVPALDLTRVFHERMVDHSLDNVKLPKHYVPGALNSASFTSSDHDPEHGGGASKPQHSTDSSSPAPNPFLEAANKSPATDTTPSNPSGGPSGTSSHPLPPLSAATRSEVDSPGFHRTRESFQDLPAAGSMSNGSSVVAPAGGGGLGFGYTITSGAAAGGGGGGSGGFGFGGAMSFGTGALGSMVAPITPLVNNQSIADFHGLAASPALSSIQEGNGAPAQEGGGGAPVGGGGVNNTPPHSHHGPGGYSPVVGESAMGPGSLLAGGGGLGLVNLTRQTSNYLDSTTTSRSDLSGDTLNTTQTSLPPTAHTGGLNSFRQNLLKNSPAMGVSSLDNSQHLYLTSRNSARETVEKGGYIDTSRMQRARNLALMFGFDGVASSEKELAERKHFAVATRCGMTRFTEPGMEKNFVERTVRESIGYARLSFLWCLLIVLQGVAFDALVFQTAWEVALKYPEAYTPTERLTPDQYMRFPHVTFLIVSGVRVLMGVPFYLIMWGLTYTKHGISMVPYLSTISMLWLILIDMVCMYLSAPAGIIIGGSRLISTIGGTIMLFRGMNVVRQIVVGVVGSLMVVVGVALADTTRLWLTDIVLYTCPLLLAPILLRHRLQVAQRSYFIERTKVARRSKEIAKEQEKADSMLLNIFPKTIYERIKGGEREIVDNHKAAVVLFADVVGFTKMSTDYTPAEVVDTLNVIFSAFDGLMAKYQLEKIKTIGDCFVCSAGVTMFNTSPFTNIANCALEMVAIIEGLRSMHSQKIEMRWGVHTGDVISAVVGEKKFLYDIFGEAVQKANLMESSSVSGRILVSDPVAQKLSAQGYVMKFHKTVVTPEGGTLDTHFLMGRRKVGRTGVVPVLDESDQGSPLSASQVSASVDSETGLLERERELNVNISNTPSPSVATPTYKAVEEEAS